MPHTNFYNLLSHRQVRFHGKNFTFTSKIILKLVEKTAGNKMSVFFGLKNETFLLFYYSRLHCSSDRLKLINKTALSACVKGTKIFFLIVSSHTFTHWVENWDHFGYRLTLYWRNVISAAVGSNVYQLSSRRFSFLRLIYQRGLWPSCEGGNIIIKIQIR